MTCFLVHCLQSANVVRCEWAEAILEDEVATNVTLEQTLDRKGHVE
jgi:hypothetical protein